MFEDIFLELISSYVSFMHCWNFAFALGNKSIVNVRYITFNDATL